MFESSGAGGAAPKKPPAAPYLGPGFPTGPALPTDSTGGGNNTIGGTDPAEAAGNLATSQANQAATTTTTTTTPAGPHYDWSNADINTILGGDPIYQQLLAFDKAASGEDLAMVNARIAKMQAYYGSDADPLSLLGRIYQSKQDRDRTIANTLAGHGMFFSGETGFQGERSRLDYLRAELDAKTKLQDYIDGLQMGLAQSQRQYKFQELQASWDAVNRWLEANQPTITSGQ